MQYKLDNPVHATIGTEKYQCTVEYRNGKFIADEPSSPEGKDPDPYTLLLSSLATCYLITMRMYIDRKGWDIPHIAVNVNYFQKPADNKTKTFIDCDIKFLTEIDDERKLRLEEIAKKSPIAKILKGEIEVRTFLFNDSKTETKVKYYRNNEITVVWKPEVCQHSARCWTQLPEVFDVKKRPWINADGASSEKIMEQIKKCPSGALSYRF